MYYEKQWQYPKEHGDRLCLHGDEDIVLNAVFIFESGRFRPCDIVRAALATVLSRVLELAWAFAESLRQFGRVKLHEISVSLLTGI